MVDVDVASVVVEAGPVVEGGTVVPVVEGGAVVPLVVEGAAGGEAEQAVTARARNFPSFTCGVAGGNA